jgi:FkbM family methyltransferase
MTRNYTPAILALGAIVISLTFASVHPHTVAASAHWISDTSSLLATNLLPELRDSWITRDGLWHASDLGAYEKGHQLLGYESGMGLWQVGRHAYWVDGIDPQVQIADMIQAAEMDVYRYRGRSVRRGDVVVDCGAFYGSFVRQALDLGASHVVAIEPMPNRAACLKKTFAPEIAQKRVSIAQVAIFSREGLMSMEGVTHSGTRLTGVTHGGTVQVRVTTLDRLLPELGIDKVDFIKMDIEGAETDALRGATQTIKKHKPLLAIATEHTDDKRQNCRSVIEQVRSFGLGYSIGYGRYLCDRPGHPCAPSELFFY